MKMRNVSRFLLLLLGIFFIVNNLVIDDALAVEVDEKYGYRDEVEVIGLPNNLIYPYLVEIHRNLIMDTGWEFLRGLVDKDYLQSFTGENYSRHINEFGEEIFSNYVEDTTRVFIYERRFIFGSIRDLKAEDIDGKDRDKWQYRFREFHLYDEDDSRPGWNDNWNDYFFKGQIYFAEVGSVFVPMYIPASATYRIEYVDRETGDILDTVEKSSFWMSNVLEYPKYFAGYEPERSSSRFTLREEHNSFSIYYKPIKEVETGVQINYLAEDGYKIKDETNFKLIYEDGYLISYENLIDYIETIDENKYEFTNISNELGEEVEFIELSENKEDNIVNLNFRTKMSYEKKYIDLEGNSILNGELDEKVTDNYLGDEIDFKIDDEKLVEDYKIKYIKFKEVEEDSISIKLDNREKDYIVYIVFEEMGEEPDKPEIPPEEDKEKPETPPEEDKERPETPPEEDRETPVTPPQTRPVLPIEPSTPEITPKNPNLEKEEIDLDKEINREIVADKLNLEDHFKYIQGYPDKSLRPNENITREEVAAVFFRLLREDYKQTIRKEKHNYLDFSRERWSSKHIATLSNGQILNGYEDGTFRPENYITRGEVATIASRFDNLEVLEESRFIDVKGHWAEKYIDSATQKGWIRGYKDGTFRADENITRAEFISLVNNVLNRKVNRENILEGIIEYIDLEKDSWYYEEMVEATNSHEYKEERLEDNSEIWKRLVEIDIEM